MKKPIYSDCSFTLFQGDALTCLQTLASDSVGAVVTDPPYSSGGASLSAKQADPSQKYQWSGTKKTYPPMLGDAKDQRSFLTWAALWLTECWRIAQDGSPILVFTDWRQLPVMTDAIQASNWRWLGIVPWDKRGGIPQKGRFRAQCEYVLFGSKGRLQTQPCGCLPGLYSCPVASRQKVHLTSKPLTLIKELLAIAPEGCIVLDPFAGGGTTAVAALETGRKCVTIELSPEYAQITLDRVLAQKSST